LKFLGSTNVSRVIWPDFACFVQDYCRYMAEFAFAETFQRYSAEAQSAYASGMAEAELLHQVHPVRLGLALTLAIHW
jgi:hypothetical protein